MTFSKLGIPIAKIAIDGLYSEKDYMQYKNGLGSEDLNTFTCCLRFNVEYLRPHDPTILSYSSFIDDNSFLVFFTHESGNKLSFKFCKYLNSNGITKFCSKKIMPSLKIHNNWHHACWLFNTDGEDLDQIKVSTKLFFDGKEVTQGETSFINLFLQIYKII